MFNLIQFSLYIAPSNRSHLRALNTAYRLWPNHCSPPPFGSGDVKLYFFSSLLLQIHNAAGILTESALVMVSPQPAESETCWTFSHLALSWLLTVPSKNVSASWLKVNCLEGKIQALTSSFSNLMQLSVYSCSEIHPGLSILLQASLIKWKQILSGGGGGISQLNIWA